MLHAAFSRLLHQRRLPDELRPYVFRSIRNAAIDVRRAEVRRARDTFVFNGAAREPVHPGARHDAEQLLLLVNDDERECIVLKIYSGLTFREIAELRSVPLNTAASWYRRGLAKMRAALEDEL